METPTGPVLLFTPGIDSLLALHALKDKDPKLVYYHLASRYTEMELHSLIRMGYEWITFDTTFNFSTIERDDAHVDHRNLHLGLHACGAYGDRIYISGTKSDRVSDNNPQIMNQLSALASKSLGREVHILSPFPEGKYKTELAQEYVADGNDPSNLAHTFSCYRPRKEPVELKYDDNGTKLPITTVECMRCKACFRKAVVLNSVGIYRAFNQPRITDEYEKNFVKGEDARSKATREYIYRVRNGGKKKES